MAKPKHGQWYNCSSPRPFPSQALLSALALIVTTPPVVAGSPLPTPPPDFLCPFIRRDNIQPPVPSTSASSTTPINYVGHQVIADRYVQGPDNLWRKTSSWTLYGSTCCIGSMTPSTSIQPYSSRTPTPSTSTSMSASTYISSAFDTSSLPAGWNNANSTSSTTDSTTILALAILLAVIICIFIVGCLFWRRRKKRARDIERKMRRTPDNSLGDVQEKDARGKMRMWTRASARWKSNIRQSARWRRRRPLSSTANRPPSPTLYDSQLSINAPSPPSRRSSFAEGQDPSQPETALCPHDDSAGQTNVQHDPPRPVSPPTYGASFHSPSTPDMCDPSPALPHSARPSCPSFIDDEPLPYIPRSDGHVAIDDKAQLAHIRELASSPPAMVDAASGAMMKSVSAPEWHEVEGDPEDLGFDLSEVPMTFRESPPPFPPPPKADIPFGYLDDILISPIPGSSAALFEASPSAPPIDYPNLEPSAPSLEEEDLFQDWDTASFYATEAPISGDHDSAPTCAVDSSPTVSLALHTSFPTRNSILPQYHP